MINTQPYLFHTVLKSLITNSYWETLPCTKQQLDACEAAWNRLVDESWDEQALTILHTLLAYAQTHRTDWDWLTAELYFEAYAFALDNRAQAAIQYIQFSSVVTDDTLDRYNQRMQRFSR